MPAAPMQQAPAQTYGQGAPAYPVQYPWPSATAPAPLLSPYPGAAAAGTDPSLSTARQASGGQRLQEALGNYRSLIAKGDDSPTVFGEMGNVLLAAGRQQEAAQAYYEASTRLIEMGQPGSVYLMLSYIETYDPLLGAILNRRLASLPRSLN
jgi:hypothetical protein